MESDRSREIFFPRQPVGQITTDPAGQREAGWEAATPLPDATTSKEALERARRGNFQQPSRVSAEKVSVRLVCPARAAPS